jgi:hypothetical protein
MISQHQHQTTAATHSLPLYCTYYTMEEPELPPLPTSHSALPPLTRKRTHTEYEINTSSDPAVFSSDDHQESSASHYSSKRRKEQWKGTWWGDRLRSTSARRKKPFERNYDSGVFMSDETDTSLEDDFLADQQARRETPSARASSPIFESYFLSATKKLAVSPAQTRMVSPSNHQAVAIIQQCLEAGSENVDLSYAISPSYQSAGH